MYNIYGFLYPNNNFDLDLAARRLNERIANSSVSRQENVVTISSGEWSIFIADVTGDHVSGETMGITDRIAGFEQADAFSLAANPRRIEIWTEDPDPMMEHFNDYLFAVEVLKSFEGVVVIDPNEPALL